MASITHVPADATPFDLRGVKLGHHNGDCSFETILRCYAVRDPVLWRIAEIVHEATSTTNATTPPRPPASTSRCGDCP